METPESPIDNPDRVADAERRRLQSTSSRDASTDWRRWGPYLAERQWGTVREDYSADAEPWTHFTHEQATWRAYRWGEDGLLGISDDQCRLCFSLALWNGNDPILKERLFGLTGPEGNHGEDVKEVYHYLNNTPTHSYMRGLYRYPQAAYPYELLRAESASRSRLDPEFELADTGAFANSRVHDVEVEYAKASPDDILIRITVRNRGQDQATLHVLPTWWFRNTWSWRQPDGDGPPDEFADELAGELEERPQISRVNDCMAIASHPTLGVYRLEAARGPDGERLPWMFTENETDETRFADASSRTPGRKDAFHQAVVEGRASALTSQDAGTKVAVHAVCSLAGGASAELYLRMRPAAETSPAFGDGFDALMTRRRMEADAFDADALSPRLDPQEQDVVQQARAGLLWSKQFYGYDIPRWLGGDATPPGQEVRRADRNTDWGHLYNSDVISMPDAWEYPWYAAWDLAFHLIPLSAIDPDFAKKQALLLLSETYLHPNGQIPAYEWNFSDVNPPVHAWACWRVYQLTGRPGHRDRVFLERAFQKLLLNFTWWVNRKDVRGAHVFTGGFLGLDNIGIFDRSQPLPMGGHLEQADGTAWMAYYCSSMLSIALDLALDNPAYEDMAVKFFEHYVTIAGAMNSLDGPGLWDDVDGFYYDQIHVDGSNQPLGIRSIVGLMPLLTVDILYEETMERLPGFVRRIEWFLKHRPDLARSMTYMKKPAASGAQTGLRLLSVPTREQLLKLLVYLLDEEEFLSPFGIRSLSKYHLDHPFEFDVHGETFRVQYLPGESDSGMFGGNSNWRGPIWFPLNYLLLEALERYHQFYGDDLRVECPTGSGSWMNLLEVADEIRRRLSSLFLANGDEPRPYESGPRIIPDEGHLLFHEYFDAESGRGLGASHQTGWTALIAPILTSLAQRREPAAPSDE